MDFVHNDNSSYFILGRPQPKRVHSGLMHFWSGSQRAREGIHKSTGTRTTENAAKEREMVWGGYDL